MLREAVGASKDCDLFPFASFLTWDSAKAARCCDKTDRFSSIGVKMLCCFRCGSFLMAEGTSLRDACGGGGGGPGLSLASDLGSIGAGMSSWLGGCICGRGGWGEARRSGPSGRP